MLTDREKDEVIEILVNAIKQSDVINVEFSQPAIETPTRDGNYSLADSDMYVTIHMQQVRKKK